MKPPIGAMNADYQSTGGLEWLCADRHLLVCGSADTLIREFIRCIGIHRSMSHSGQRAHRRGESSSDTFGSGSIFHSPLCILCIFVANFFPSLLRRVQPQ